jgi:hypothetical protein
MPWGCLQPRLAWLAYRARLRRVADETRTGIAESHQFIWLYKGILLRLQMDIPQNPVVWRNSTRIMFNSQKA